MFFPTNKEELKKIGWQQLDIIIITGDAYIDHPGFGAAIIANYLYVHGFKVGIIDQPDWKSDKDFLKLGSPKLFFGVTSGNMDSMINRYTAQKKIRSYDNYSPNGDITKRPDRAVIVYSQMIRKLFGKIPIVLGGIEASMRRIPHYDYWQDKIRNSILFDSRADFLVYGMGEKQTLQIARSLQEGKNPQEITEIRGTVVSVSKPGKSGFHLKEFDKKMFKEDFWKMNIDFEKNYRSKVIYQRFNLQYLKHNPPAHPLNEREMDFIYDLPFERTVHPKYKGKEIKAFEQIKTSVTSHRGCFGGCNFCAIGYHQGKTIQSRSINSIRWEIDKITKKKYFHGTISDVGGPTANMYKMICKLNISETCTRKSCIYPSICKHLETSHKPNITLLKELYKNHKIKHLFVASGIRFDLALLDDNYTKLLAEKHTGGLLKLAPEHKSKNVLKYMFKPDFRLYEQFTEKFLRFGKEAGKKQAIVPYIIVGHPGSTLKDTLELAKYLKRKNIKLRQIQEFTPTPMSASTMMYYTGYDLNKNKINVPKGREIHLQKALIQWFIPQNRKLVIEALKKIGRISELDFFYGKNKRNVKATKKAKGYKKFKDAD